MRSDQFEVKGNFNLRFGTKFNLKKISQCYDVKLTERENLRVRSFY